MRKELLIQTRQKTEFVDITSLIEQSVREEKVKLGSVHVFIPHTTAAVTINENADPDVVSDMVGVFDTLIPKYPFKHAEGNSPAHIKSSLIGVSLVIEIVDERLSLGTWQGVYFCEFDGPRRRSVFLTFDVSDK